MSRHVPAAEGTAAGRILLATVEGLRAEGHETTVLSWGPGPPPDALPAGCDWAPLGPDRGPAGRWRSLLRPRDETGRAGWSLPGDAVLVADDPLSFGAVRRGPQPVVTLHYLTRLDAAALGRRRAGDVQGRRLERRVARRAEVTLAYSPRVAAAAGGTFVPAAVAVPDQAAPPVPAPVAGLVADWGWAPNRVAAGRLLEAWPEIRRQVPGARLLLAGRNGGDLSLGSLAGVEWLGEVARAADVLTEVALVPFPCPDTSGPKGKVLEAVAAGRPVVTTPAGAEGLLVEPGEGAVVVAPPRFATAVAGLLADDARRAEVGARGRAAVERHHGPRAAARARVRALAGVAR